MNIKDLHNRLTWIIEWLPFYHFDTLNRERIFKARHAANLINICKVANVEPKTLIDVGANESQFAYWLQKEWTNLKIISFEPNTKFKPLGDVHYFGLGESKSSGHFSPVYAERILTGDSDESIKIVRFDSLDIQFSKPAILKVDCENMSASALLGFGNRINDFDLVCVEMTGDEHAHKEMHGQPAKIWQFMLENGFNRSAFCDAAYHYGTVPFCDVAFWKDSAVGQTKKDKP